MFDLLKMWALVEVLGFICLPLTLTVCHNLPDRGWALSKAIGMAVLAFFVWLPLMIFHSLPYSPLFILGVLLLIVAGNLVGVLRVRQTILKLVRVNFTYIIASEVVFLGMVFLLGWIRSYGPDIRNYEMFMDEGFIASIMRSTHFPPNDMWFAGYSLNYYYYAHFTIATLAKLLGQPPSVAFNTGISIFFGLTAVNLFSVTCNIVAWARSRRIAAKKAPGQPMDEPDTIYPSLLPAIPFGFLSMLMGLLLGNLASTQQWWKDHGDATPYDWFWGPTRVIDRTINEFPAFSFLLSCFHAHVLALAFTILAIGLAFNIVLAESNIDGPDGIGSRGLRLFGRGWQLPLTLGTMALVLGGLFTMNGWDFPTYVGLSLLCIIIQQWLAHGSRFSFELALNIFTAGAALTALSFLLYAPFYLNFISPAQGLGVVTNPNDRSPLNDEILIYGLFAFIFISLIIASAVRKPLFPRPEQQSKHLFGISWLNMLVVYVTVVILAAILIALIVKNGTTFALAGSIAVVALIMVLYHMRDRSLMYILLMGMISFGLVAFCEVFYLRDVFASSYPRMNTVFKFYFQAWAMLSIVSGAGLYFMLESFRPSLSVPVTQRWMQRSFQVVWSVVLLVFLLAGAIYPVAGADARTNHFTQRSNSLDGLNYLQAIDPGDYNAIRWLNNNVSGDPVIVEAIGDDYSDFARVSAFTGLPTLMGWVGHEYQWRVNWLNNSANAIDFNRRSSDVDTIYTDPRPDVVLSTMSNYHAQYLYVGPLEQVKYASTNVDLHRFSSFMRVVYSADGVTIYQVK